VRQTGSSGISTVLCAALAIAGLVTRPHARSPQDPAPPQGPSFRGGIEIVVVEASVVDKAGVTVRGLTPQDFQVEFDGKAREVVAADLIEHRPPADTRNIDLASNESGLAGRSILLMVDQTSLRSESRAVLNRAERWLRTLGPADRVGFVTLPVTGPNVDFTTDHARIRKALGSAVIAPDARAPIVSLRNVSVYEGLRIHNGDLFTRNDVISRECRGEERSCPNEIEMAARDIWMDSQFRVQAVLNAFYGLMRGLRAMPGVKHVVLLSSGWPIDERTAASEVPSIGAEAALANVVIHTFTSESWALAAALSQPSHSIMQDQNLLLTSVEMLSGMTGGLAARVLGDGEAAFKDLDNALASYYRLGIRPDAGDLDGKPHAISIKVKRPGVRLRSYRKLLAATRAAPALTSADPTTALRAAVESPAVVTGLDLRAAAYVLHGEASEPGSVRVVLVGDVDRAAPGLATSLAVLYDPQGRPVGNEGQDLELTASRSRFKTALAVAPGLYRARIAVRDADGRIGSVERTVDARWQKAGGLETTGLALLVAGQAGNAAEPVLETVSSADRLVAQLSLRGPAVATPPEVGIAVAQAGVDGQVLLRLNARVARTTAGATVAQQYVPVGLLPPGRYVISATLPDSDTRYSRAVIVEPSAAPPTSGAGAAALLARPPRFELQAALDPDVVAPLLERLAARPELGPAREAIERVKRGPWPAEILTGPLQSSPLASAFVGGLGRLQRGDLEGAATSFRDALRAAPDFTPSMLYLGACYAAGARDREAAGAWQTALTRERDMPLLSHLAIEAWLRADRPAAALALARQARERWPGDEGFARGQAMAALAGGQPAQGIELVAAMDAVDPSLLLAALGALYEARRDGAPLWSVDRDAALAASLRDRYRAAGGDSMALVDLWQK
jgi:VWFA-related protein